MISTPEELSAGDELDKVGAAASAGDSIGNTVKTTAKINVNTYASFDGSFMIGKTTQTGEVSSLLAFRHEH